MNLQLFASDPVLELAEVERGADGLPTSIPLFSAGDNHLTIRGHPAVLALELSDLQSIVDYHRSKGAKIPLDSRHVLSNLAGRLQIDEAELLRRMPRLAGTAGFGHLELRGETLYLAEIDYNEIGREVLAAELVRYYSPTIRGLDGKSPLRVTSVALDNEPCLNNLSSLAASETDDTITPEAVKAALDKIKEQIMPEDEKDKTQTPPAAADPKPAAPDLMALIREVLGDDVTPENLAAKLAALKTGSESNAELAEKVKSLECAEESRKLAAAKEKGFRRGVLVAADLDKPYLQKMDSAQLSEYCDSLPDGCRLHAGTLELGGGGRTKPTDPPKKYNSVAEAIADAPTAQM